MNYLFYVGHPAHYFFLSHAAAILTERGHKITFLVREKDIVLDLIDYSYETIILKKTDGKSVKFNFVRRILKRLRIYFSILRKKKIDVLCGHDFLMPPVARIFGKKVVYFTEDDYHIIPLAAKIGFRFAPFILASDACDLGKYSHKQLAYRSYQKAAYIHPRYFQPDPDVRKKYVAEEKNYYILRVVELKAYHDIKNQVKGITNELLVEIISMLEKRGEVILSAERDLPAELKRYQRNIHPKDMHHLMAYADMFISDSQSMSVESALMGLPNIRFHTYQMDFGIINDLEYNHHLTETVRDGDELIKKLKYMLSDDSLKEKYKKRAEKLISGKIDITSYLVELLEDPEIYKK